jgi:hypothetical protein
MAKLLGLTVETVSRIMAQLRRDGILDAPRGRIAIAARARLRALAEGAPAAMTSKGKSRPRRRSAYAARKPPARRARGAGQSLRLS